MKHTFCVLRFTFFFFFFLVLARVFALRDNSTVYALLSIVHALFSIVHGLKNIKNRSHGIIQKFKNYFVLVFSIFNFQFQQK